MHRRDALAAGGSVLAALSLAGCTGDDQEAFAEGFENGLDGWETAAHIGPEEPLSAFEYEIGVSEEHAATGAHSLRVFTEGDHDDGTAWATRQIAAPDGPARARVSLSFWSESESFNVLRHAVARLGAEPPDAEDDFPDPGQNTSTLPDAPYGGLREPLHLTEGWREYSFEWNVPADVDALFVSVGVSVIWESDATHFIDDVRVELTPR